MVLCRKPKCCQLDRPPVTESKSILLAGTGALLVTGDHGIIEVRLEICYLAPNGVALECA